MAKDNTEDLLEKYYDDLWANWYGFAVAKDLRKYNANDNISFITRMFSPRPNPTTRHERARYWLRKNLFGTFWNSLGTIVATLFILFVVYKFVDLAIIAAVIGQNGVETCRASEGYNTAPHACWIVIKSHLTRFIFGFYPEEHYWRAVAVMIILPLSLSSLFTKLNFVRSLFLTVIVVFVARFLVLGGFGLEGVPLVKIGGALLPIAYGFPLMYISLSLGFLLFFGLQFAIAPIRWMAVGISAIGKYIPLIVLMYSSVTLSILSLSPGVNPDIITRLAPVLILPTAVTISETLHKRFGLYPKALKEQSTSLGLSQWQSITRLQLPHSYLKSRADIFDAFAELFKNMSLINLIGLLGPIGFAQIINGDEEWVSVRFEFYFTIAVFYWVFSFTLRCIGEYFRNKWI